MIYKKNILKLIIFSFLNTTMFLLAFALLSIKYDPLQLLQYEYFDTKKFNHNMRIQARGMIKNCDFDSIIIGTSMLENTSSAEASKKLNGNFVNISISGSDFFERHFILDYLFKHKQIKKVIYSLDRCYLQAQEGHPEFPIENWSFLYNDSLIDDFKIYFPLKMLKNNCIQNVNIDRPNEWASDPHHSCRFGGIQNWIKNKHEQGLENFINNTLPEQAKLSLNKNDNIPKKTLPKNIKNYLDQYLIRYVQDNTNTTFYFIFPPYFKYYYASLRQNNHDAFSIHQETIRYLVEKSSTFTNMKVFGFENENFTYNISLYKDTTHYHESINSLILDSIANNKNIITEENLQSYLKNCERQAFDYDMNELNNKFQKALQLYSR